MTSRAQPNKRIRIDDFITVTGGDNEESSHNIHIGEQKIVA